MGSNVLGEGYCIFPHSGYISVERKVSFRCQFNNEDLCSEMSPLISAAVLYCLLLIPERWAGVVTNILALGQKTETLGLFTTERRQVVKFCDLIQYNKSRTTIPILLALFWRTKLNGTGRL